MQIVEQTAEDVRPLVEAAFERPVVGELADLLREGPAHLVSLVALDPDPVGHVQLSRAWVDDAARVVPVAVLSPLAVRPDRQRQGVGTALVAAALTWARDHGETAVFLEGDPAYYGPRGFEAATPRGFVRPSTRIPRSAFQVSVLRDDRVQGALVYSDAFWRLDLVGLR